MDPPEDVAHIQFRSRIAFKLVWAPTPKFDQFVLVDDGTSCMFEWSVLSFNNSTTFLTLSTQTIKDGKLLAEGKPTGILPALRERQMNYKIVQGSKYAVEAERIAKGVATE